MEVAFTAPAVLKVKEDLFYILNAQVALRAVQLIASAASFQRPLVCSNATLWGSAVGARRCTVYGKSTMPAEVNGTEVSVALAFETGAGRSTA